ncbi:hypothetical protein AYO21_02508 [Fonsecaea monophora]|uniref:Uncharacterized protein n=1 Tax=Fonsecaea monophora TaxID=254056 RepID=A0A177FIG0_9EURO|nr:hypothetical protein AYO21_02508 [Fonsecaea monophora]KAH0834596.1 hypothetical protein FOPE_03732 [Fonsecaea pedrosoi]OAG43222.1 hypothetical protein AYO21_02508 [Fonsecaea monophora]
MESDLHHLQPGLDPLKHPYVAPLTSPEPDEPYAFLKTFDTIFLINDSDGQPWYEYQAALAALPTCKLCDSSGFVNCHGLYLCYNLRSEYRYHNRRGRGKRRNEAFWTDFNSRPDTDIFDGRDCLFEDEKGSLKTPALANLDTGLKVPGGLIMSSQYAKEIGRYQDISQDFVDPCLRSVSGHLTPVTGVLRDVVFRVKGSSVTFKRNFFVCDAIDGLVDIMFGAHFITDQFKMLFGRVKECLGTFATWFSTRKETNQEREERERRERDQKIKANEREIARLRKEQQMLEAAKRQSQGGGPGPGQ